jgi:hypothetical protein
MHNGDDGCVAWMTEVGDQRNCEEWALLASWHASNVIIGKFCWMHIQILFPYEIMISFLLSLFSDMRNTLMAIVYVYTMTPDSFFLQK